MMDEEALGKKLRAEIERVGFDTAFVNIIKKYPEAAGMISDQIERFRQGSFETIKGEEIKEKLETEPEKLKKRYSKYVWNKSVFICTHPMWNIFTEKEAHEKGYSLERYCNSVSRAVACKTKNKEANWAKLIQIELLGMVYEHIMLKLAEQEGLLTIIFTSDKLIENKNFNTYFDRITRKKDNFLKLKDVEGTPSIETEEVMKKLLKLLGVKRIFLFGGVINRCLSHTFDSLTREGLDVRIIPNASVISRGFYKPAKPNGKGLWEGETNFTNYPDKIKKHYPKSKGDKKPFKFIGNELDKLINFNDINKKLNFLLKKKSFLWMFKRFP